MFTTYVCVSQIVATLKYLRSILVMKLILFHRCDEGRPQCSMSETLFVAFSWAHTFRGNASVLDASAGMNKGLLSRMKMPKSQENISAITVCRHTTPLFLADHLPLHLFVDVGCAGKLVHNAARQDCTPLLRHRFPASCSFPCRVDRISRHSDRRKCHYLGRHPLVFFLRVYHRRVFNACLFRDGFQARTHRGVSVVLCCKRQRCTGRLYAICQIGRASCRERVCPYV